MKGKLHGWVWGGWLCLGVLGAIAPVGAADNAGQNPAAYLELGPGGLTTAMGGAGGALRGDLTEAFFNPAGLVALPNTQVEFARSLLSLNRVMDYFAVGSNYEKAYYFGLALTDYSAGNDLQARSGPSADPDSVFSDLNLNLMTTIAFPLAPDLDFGFNLKLFLQAYTLADLPTGFGLGEDLGFQVHPDADTVWGLTIKDPLSDFLYSDGTEHFFPRGFRVGFSRRWADGRVKWDLDLEWRSDLGWVPHGGLEWRPARAIALRGGAWSGLDSGEWGWGAGVGIFLGVAGAVGELDYTLSPDRLDADGLLQQISLVGNFQ
ncbi:MAG TPA: hypothetical protein VMU88_02045 [bacterium]|nr:hypothetical protein [bacterium]